ncbi:MAG TPA: thioredoxin [Desulfobacteraceae bacterium]|nr:thioredoxin [Desulfobacteraceae bacterium]
MGNNSLIISCNNCGTKNRVPGNSINQKPLCGRCKMPLSEIPVLDRPVDITDNSFNSEIQSFSGPVLVDCWAPWCGPCRMVAPVLEQLAQEYAGRIKIAKLNVDENPVTASKYSIQSIPTMLLFKDGKLVDTLVGALSRGEIKKRMQLFI